MSHITASPPCSPSLPGLWPWLRCSQLSTLSHGEWKGSIIPTQPNVFKDSNECNAVTQKMDFREGEGGGKKQSCVCGGALSLYSPPLILSPPLLVRTCVCLCACACAYTCIMCLCACVCLCECIWVCRGCVCVCAGIACVSERLSGWAEISIKREWVQADRQDHCGVN